MNIDRDTTRIVRSWLRTDQNDSADRVLGAVLDRLDATPQRMATSWPARTLPNMHRAVVINLAAAAAVVVALLGFAMVATSVGGPGFGTPPSQAPPTADLSPVAGLPASGDLDSGTYRVNNPDWTPRSFTVTVPAGWRTAEGFISKGRGLEPKPEVFGELSFSTWIVTHVFEDACLRPEGDAGSLVEAGTPEELVEALTDQTGHETAGPSATILGGYPAHRMEFLFPADYDLGPCGDRLLRLWPGAGPEIAAGLPAAAGQNVIVHVVDVEGDAVVVASAFTDDASMTDIGELEAIVRSIRFEEPSR